MNMQTVRLGGGRKGRGGFNPSFKPHLDVVFLEYAPVFTPPPLSAKKTGVYLPQIVKTLR
jgi:hypothetical protein